MGKKIIAGLLLALFVFIQAEKVFHTHEKTNNSPGHNGVGLQSISNGCTICDFQLSKDSELPELSLTAATITFLQNEPAFFTCSYHSGSVATLSDRGPPAI